MDCKSYEIGVCISNGDISISQGYGDAYSEIIISTDQAEQFCDFVMRTKKLIEKREASNVAGE